MKAPVLWLLHHLNDDQGSSGSSWIATPLLYLNIIRRGRGAVYLNGPDTFMKNFAFTNTFFSE